MGKKIKKKRGKGEKKSKGGEKEGNLWLNILRTWEIYWWELSRLSGDIAARNSRGKGARIITIIGERTAPTSPQEKEIK